MGCFSSTETTASGENNLKTENMPEMNRFLKTKTKFTQDQIVETARVLKDQENVETVVKFYKIDDQSNIEKVADAANLDADCKQALVDLWGSGMPKDDLKMDMKNL